MQQNEVEEFASYNYHISRVAKIETMNLGSRCPLCWQCFYKYKYLVPHNFVSASSQVSKLTKHWLVQSGFLHLSQCIHKGNLLIPLILDKKNQLRDVDFFTFKL